MTPLNLDMNLVIAGMVFLLAEVFVTSYGVLAFIGIICLALGMDHPLVWPAAFAAMVATALAVGWMIRTGRRRGPSPFFTHAASEGHVMRALGQEGAQWFYQVKIDGEIWRAVSTHDIPEGAPVLVTAQNAPRLLLSIVPKT